MALNFRPLHKLTLGSVSGRLDTQTTGGQRWPQARGDSSVPPFAKPGEKVGRRPVLRTPRPLTKRAPGIISEPHGSETGRSPKGADRARDLARNRTAEWHRPQGRSCSTPSQSQPGDVAAYRSASCIRCRRADWDAHDPGQQSHVVLQAPIASAVKCDLHRLGCSKLVAFLGAPMSA